MTILPSIFAILVILPTITNQAQTLSSKGSVIDWLECGKETECYCTNDAVPPLLVKEPASIEKEPDPRPDDVTDDDVGKCDIGLQLKYFTVQTSLLQLQIFGKPDPGSDANLMLYHGDDEFIGCKFVNGKVEVAGIKIHQYRVSLFEKRSHCKEGSCLCSLLLDRANILNDDADDFNVQSQTSSIRLSTQSEIYTRSENRLDWARNRKPACNPYSFKELSASPEFQILSLKNKDKRILSCEKDYGEAFSMRYKKNEEDELGMSELKCAQEDPNNQLSNYYYYIVREVTEVDQTTGEEVKKKVDEIIKDPGEYAFYCAATVNELCKNPNNECDPNVDPKCPRYESGSTGKAATLTCPDNKWLIDGEYYVVDEEVVCSQDKISGSNEVAFFITPPSSPDKKVEGVDRFQCFTNYDCMKKSKLHFPDCDDEDITKCGSVLYDGDNLRCNKTEINMTIFFAESNENGTATSLTCERATGLWKDNTGETIAAKSRVRCIEIRDMREKAEAEMSTGQIAGYICVSLVVTLIIIGIITGLRVFCIYRKVLFRSPKRMWLKGSKEWRIKEAKSTIGDMMTANTVLEFTDTLQLLDLLLDAEIQDPEVWEEVYPFLWRTLAVIIKTDHHMWHMFTRYLYLQAKKIIDKHGWISAKPIDRSNQSGLMRTVAIRLLGFCLGDPINEEADQLIEEGFRKLGFKGRQQYPHCGAMWATISHIRPRPHVRKSEGQSGTPVPFNYDHFVATLERISFNSKSVLPEKALATFGSCSRQAAFALGGHPNIAYHALKGRINLLNKKAENGVVSMSYFMGICGSLTRNPSQVVVETFDMLGSPMDTLLPQLYRVHSELEWSKRVTALCKIVTYHGRHLDAKFLLGKLVPSMAPRPNEPNEFITELYTEQQQFEKAFEKQIEDVRQFLANHTDKKQLKEKPVYLTSGKTGELDSRVSTGAVVQCAFNPKSCGGSDRFTSDTKSDANSNPDSKPAPDPQGSNSTAETASTPERAAAAAP